MEITTKRVFSGIKPTGRLTIGNYLGALRRFVRSQRNEPGTVERADSHLFCVVDLHALTVRHDPARLRDLVLQTGVLYLAAGLDPDRSVLFRQSDVPAHTELAYLLECTGFVGELKRMIQYREKGGQPRTRVSLFTYPVLMAADILIYDSTEVPVGDDQQQHLELTRTLAKRFNRRYGETFTVPEMVPARVAARVADLTQPTRKMSKESPDDAPGVIRMLDSPDSVGRKVSRAVTDSMRGRPCYDPEVSPGVSNLLDILGACTDQVPAELADRYVSYRALKADVTDAVNATLAPIRSRYAELASDPATVRRIFAEGAERAAALAAPKLRRIRGAIGVGTP